jgi:hypothetical protein
MKTEATKNFLFDRKDTGKASSQQVEQNPDLSNKISENTVANSKIRQNFKFFFV